MRVLLRLLSPLLGVAVAIAGGLLAVEAGWVRRDVRLTDPADDVTVVTSPRSLARLVGHQVRAEDGVCSASVTASARRVRVRVISSMNTEAQLRPTLTTRVDELVGGLPLARKPKVQVVVDSPKDRR